MKFRDVVVQQINATIHNKLWCNFDPRLQTYALTFLKYENCNGPRHRPTIAILIEQNLVVNSFVYKSF